ncbi:beta-N-acetylglucosaminidase domain-containing protein [Lacticaseibacillus daqingensis]|uniref:beta-N-acetylglucosaminidase domain-containing protein n=1 Tax=Lacticaseibacillus daqingensis TaxID=2486014 RepID=UPI000F7B239B|nr:beta-N-acetylglucosaminidase domain-containing protein [Lacticaseibacillus daqingensis]
MKGPNWEPKPHYRLYKAGKLWRAVMIAGVGATLIGVQGQLVKADATPEAPAATVTTTPAAEPTQANTPADDAPTSTAGRDQASPVVTSAPATEASTAETSAAPVITTAASPAVTADAPPVDAPADASAVDAPAVAAAQPAAVSEAEAVTPAKQTIIRGTIGASNAAATDALLQALAGHPELSQISIGLAGDASVDAQVTALGQTTANLATDGYLIHSGTVKGQTQLVIEGVGETGLAYAIADLTKRLATTPDLSQIDVHESPEMPIRGVIEGFYGQPWSDQARKDLFAFMGEHRMNVYIYSPKDDDYLRKDWRALYPADQLAALKTLVDSATANHVQFVYTLSPGNDIAYGSDADYQATVAKLNQLKSIGVQQFYIALDDIPLTMTAADRAQFPNRPSATYPNNGWSGLADAQAYYLNRVEKDYIVANGLPHLWLVPTNYSGSARDPFKEAQGETLDPNIRMQWTGEGVFSATITADSISRAKTTYNTDHLFIWDNFPVNDSNQDRLYLNPLEGRADDLYTVTDGFTANPMIQPYASWIGIAGYADYTWESATYKPEQTLQNTLDELAGPDAQVRQTLAAFVDLNQYWDYAAPADKRNAPILSGLLAAYRNADLRTTAGQAAKTALIDQLQLIIDAPTRLQQMAVKGFYDDAKPWLTAAAAWATAELQAIALIDQIDANQLTGPQAVTQLDQLQAAVATAMVKAIPNSRTGDPTPVFTPTVGDGVFQALIDLAYNRVDTWLNLVTIPENPTPLTGLAAGTNLGTYGNNGPANMVDGDPTTKFWSNGNVTADSVVYAQLPEVTDVQRIVLQQGTSDAVTSGDIFGDADIYVGAQSDGSDWVLAGHVTASGRVQIDLPTPVPTRYVVVYANGATDAWLQVRELTVYGPTGGASEHLVDVTGTIQQAFDTVKTRYEGQLAPDQPEGMLEKDAATPLTGIHSAVLVGAAKGSIQILVAGEWQTLGQTDGTGTVTRLAVEAPTVDGIRFIPASDAGQFKIYALGLSPDEVPGETAPTDNGGTETGGTTTDPDQPGTGSGTPTDLDQPGTGSGTTGSDTSTTGGASGAASGTPTGNPADAQAKGDQQAKGKPGATGGAQHLPQTGNVHAANASIWGSLLVLLTSLGGALTWRRKHTAQ